jgi:mono/diheme cytochrome c family protein
MLMKIKQLLTISLAAAGLAGYSGASLADAAAGKATFDEICAECHEAADFEGEDAAEVTATVKKIVAGQMKHKKALKLTDQQAADVAAYMASGGK